MATAPAAPPAPAAPSVSERNLKANRSYWASYAWPQGGDEWSAALGGTEALWFTIILPRIAAFVPTGHLLEIAPGHGRCTQFLRTLCDRLTIVDLVPECIQACRKRFGEDSNITFAVNDGRTLPMVDDGSVDFAFTWDSLVHVEHETVRSYLSELSRKLKPGGLGFIHHSNLGQYEGQTARYDQGKDLHGRGKTMTAAKFRADCAPLGLRCVAQELIPWGSTGLLIDAFSLVQRDADNSGDPPQVEERTDWRAEVAQSRRIAKLYRTPTRTRA